MSTNTDKLACDNVGECDGCADCDGRHDEPAEGAELAANDSRINTQAQESAAWLLRHGWNEPGSAFNVVTYHRTRAALDKALGRHATNDELRAFTLEVRARLDAGRPADRGT